MRAGHGQIASLEVIGDGADAFQHRAEIRDRTTHVLERRANGSDAGRTTTMPEVTVTPMQRESGGEADRTRARGGR